MGTTLGCPLSCNTQNNRRVIQKSISAILHRANTMVFLLMVKPCAGYSFAEPKADIQCFTKGSSGNIKEYMSRRANFNVTLLLH